VYSGALQRKLLKLDRFLGQRPGTEEPAPPEQTSLELSLEPANEKASQDG